VDCIVGRCGAHEGEEKCTQVMVVRAEGMRYLGSIILK
jgi:hypothetical protein